MRDRLLERGLCGLLALLPLAVFPPVERPFSTAKLFVLGAAALLALGRIPAHPRPSVALKAVALGAAWMLTVLPSWWGSFGTGRALAVELAAGVLLVALLLRPPPEAALRWLAVSG